MSTGKLIVKEKYSRYWPMIAGLSGVMCLLFLGGYILVSDVLIEGYLRLAAFGFFALCILSLFKVKEGQIQIQFKVDRSHHPEMIEILYTVRGHEIHNENHELKEISDLKVTEVPNRSFYNDIVKGDKAVRFKKKDMAGWMYLNEIYGRIIPLTNANAKKITGFIIGEQSK